MRRDIGDKILSEEVSEPRQSARHKRMELKPEIQRQKAPTRPDFVALFFPDPSPPTSWWKGVRKGQKNPGGWEEGKEEKKEIKIKK